MAAAAADNLKHASAGDTELAYIEVGRGEPIVFVHGGLQDYRPRPVFTCDMARRITRPTLLTQGTRSPAYFGAVVDELERCLPASDRVRIDASHSVPAENLQAFDDAVLAFLAKHPHP